MKLLTTHNKNARCPRCKADHYCEDCALCKSCQFSAPLVRQPQDPTLPRECPDCHQTSVHARLCPVTVRRAAN